MCLICVEYKKGNLNTGEALRALKEMKTAQTDVSHANEIIKKLLTDATDRIKKATNER